VRLRSSQLPDVFGPCRGDAIRGMVEAGTAPSVCGFDAGRLIALDRNDRRMIVLLARARETGACVTIQATALAQTIRRPDS
jgi:hypothetical protein